LPATLILLPVLSLMFCVSLPALVWKLEQIDYQTQITLRQVRLENIRWQRNLKLLSDHPVAELLASNSSSSIKVALREAAHHVQSHPSVQLEQYVVKEGESIEIDDDLSQPLHALEIYFEGALVDSTALLLILDHLADISEWRAVEVRACALQRLVSEPRIAVACTIDVYDWSWG